MSPALGDIGDLGHSLVLNEVCRPGSEPVYLEEYRRPAMRRTIYGALR